jgi:hypothetical protein
MVAFVGWLAQEREAGRRSVSAGSLPQYLTAARTFARSLFGSDTETTTMPLLSALQRAYAKWEAENYPSVTHRGRAPADIVQAIWSHAIQSQARNVVRYGAAVVLAYVLGLRESLSLPANGVTWDENKVTAQLVVVKGKALRHSIRSSYQLCATNLPSPVDLVAQWDGMRTAHPLFFGMPGEYTEWRSGGCVHCDVAFWHHPPLYLQAARGPHTPCVLVIIPSARCLDNLLRHTKRGLVRGPTVTQ